MNRTAFLVLCITPVMLGACDSSKDAKKKKKDLMTQTLGQRLDRPDLTRESPFQKFMSNPKNGKDMGTRFQNQSYRSPSFTQAQKAAGMSQSFKTPDASGIGASSYGESGFAQSDKKSLFTQREFGADSTYDASKASPAGKSVFGSSDRMFGTESALTKRLQTARPPKIIEERGSDASKSYSEDEIKKLLGRQ